MDVELSYFFMVSPLKTITGMAKVSSAYEVTFVAHTHFS
jgi:hypothetical protein